MNHNNRYNRISLFVGSKIVTVIVMSLLLLSVAYATVYGQGGNAGDPYGHIRLAFSLLFGIPLGVGVFFFEQWLERRNGKLPFKHFGLVLILALGFLWSFVLADFVFNMMGILPL